MNSTKQIRVPLFDLRVLDTNLRAELTEAFTTVLDHGRLFGGGPELDQFEKIIVSEIGTRYAVGVGSGSSALYMALKACGIGPDDEVITTPLTWIITINAIAACGATPIFADVRRDFNIDPESIEKRITSKTKAIVPVHYVGHMCEMDSICAIAEKNGLMVIEDAAQAFGASLNGKMAGSFSIAAGFSMNPMKVLGGYGEAGVVVTNEEEIYRRLKRLRHAGTTSDPKKIITNECLDVSLNHKMDTINAALLLIALKHLPEKQKKQEAIARRYDNELPVQIEKQGYLKNEIHGRHLYAIKCKNRDRLKTFLDKNQIETRIMYEPLASDAPVYSHLNSKNIQTAREILLENLIIPSHEKLSEHQLDYVINKMHEFFL